jgi:hypothetical protein
MAMGYLYPRMGAKGEEDATVYPDDDYVSNEDLNETIA